MTLHSPPQGNRATDFAIVCRQFAELTAHRLDERASNLLEHRQERRDVVFFVLADCALQDKPFLERLTRLSAQWLQRCPCETTRAIAAYTAYLRDDYGRAATYLLACIADNPQNLDNWVDLAFALNHMADPLGRHILFNHDEYIIRFMARGDRVCTLSRLQTIMQEIEADGAGYATVWRTMVPPFEGRD